ncbi:MAG: choice-of-anchor D domain-containing protein [Verrucomicrobiaceae bacterium]|nr:choice-of-anchor D domain-containing protein [Verrucomicrobiaceae bacterium]
MRFSSPRSRLLSTPASSFACIPDALRRLALLVIAFALGGAGLPVFAGIAATSVSITAPTPTAVEGGSTGLYTFIRTGSTSGALTVNFQFDPASTATGGTGLDLDFSFTPASGLSYNQLAGTGTIVIPDGQASASITVTARVETFLLNPAEADEFLRFNVVAGSGYVPGSPASADITIPANSTLVTNTNDNGTGSLRQAVLNANAFPGTDAITFSDGAGFSVNFTDSTPDTITLTSQLQITAPLIIAGTGADKMTVSGGGTTRLFFAQNAGSLRFTGLTMADGKASDNRAGGAIYSENNALVVLRCVFRQNQALSGGAMASFAFAGIPATADVVGCTFVQNSATGIFSDGSAVSSYGGAGNGGGSATTRISNCTFDRNASSAANGAVYGSNLSGTSNTTITNCTFSGNTTGVAGGRDVAVSGSSSTISVGNCILASGGTAWASDSGGTLTSLGNNLTAGPTGPNNGTTDRINTDPLLLPLANNGGTTPTLAFSPGSLARDGGSAALLPADTFDLDGDSNTTEPLPLDQRGFPFLRQVGGSVDIGALEYVPTNTLVDITADGIDGDFTPGHLSLREAVFLANLDPGDNTITFAPALLGQTVTLTQPNDPIVVQPVSSAGKLVISNPAGPTQLSVSGTDVTRHFNVSTGADVTITGLTLTHGNAGSLASGGSIASQGTLRIQQCVLSHNTAGIAAAGGALTSEGALTLEDSTVSDNVSGGYGGGLSVAGTTVITRCTIRNNTGGTLGLSLGQGSGGGGISNSGPSTLTVTDSTISGNTALVGGGGGGGLHNGVGNPTTILTNVTISGNVVANSASVGGEGGGGILMDFGSITATNCTITGNSMPHPIPGSYDTGGAGGVRNRSGTFTASNTIIAGNTISAQAGPIADFGGALTSLGHNLIGDPTGMTGATASDFIGTPLSGAGPAVPLEAKLGPLAGNGGPTQTHALLPGSPTINAGDNAQSASLTNDQRGPGFPRRIGIVDIGAYESDATPEITVSGNGTDIANGDSTPSTADHTNFGSVNVAGAVGSRTFTIANIGTAPLHLTGTAPNLVTLAGSSDFNISTQPTSTVAATNGTTLLVIAFNPSSPGPKTATVTIANDDSDENPFNFSIQGTGVVASPLSSPAGDVVTGGGAPDEAGTASIGTFDVLKRGGYFAKNGNIVFPGQLLIGSGSPPVTLAPNTCMGLWKDNGSGLKLLARSGNDAPETGSTAAKFDVLPQIPAINDSGEVTFLASLAVNPSSTPPTTTDNDTGLWSELGGTGLGILIREGDVIPLLPAPPSPLKVGAFASGAFATAHTSATTGEAAFAITIKDGAALTDTAILRTSIAGAAVTAVGLVARENAAAPGTAETFANLAGSYSDPMRMDATGNLAFVALTKPSNKEGLWYQPVAGATTKVFIAGDTAPGTTGATFKNIKSPAIGSGGVITFRGLLNNDGDNAAGLKNDGIWRGTGSTAAGYTCILRRGDDNTNRAGLGLPVGAKVGNLWHSWLTNANHGAWKGWLDVGGDGTSSTAAGDVNAIYTDMSGTMSMLLKVGDAAPGIAGATFSGFDLPIVGGQEQLAFLGTVTGPGITAGTNDKGVWRCAPNGGALTLVLRIGDTMNTTAGTRTIKNVDFPGSGNTDRRWEQPVMDGTGRVLIFVTSTGVNGTAQVIAP